MGWHLQRYIAKAGRAVNPLVWKRVWKENEGKQLNDVASRVAQQLNDEIAQVARVSQYRYWWWANPLGAGLICYGVYKVWYMSYMAHKQRTVAQIVAGAYGQGGQWLNPVPNNTTVRNMGQSASDSEEERLLQEQFNSIAFCNFKEQGGQSLCSEQVRVVGHDCKFCRKRFCVRHLLPEVHGCNPKSPKLNKHGRPKKRP